MSNRQANSLPAIKGSWEDLLGQAQTMAGNQNDAAIPIYQKLIDRLSGMSEKMRASGGGRLQGVLNAAATDLQSYFAMRGRYEDAIPIIQFLQEIDAENRESWRVREADMLMMADRPDEGIAIVTELAQGEDSLAAWVQVASRYAELDRMDEADEVLNHMQEIADKNWAADDLSNEAQGERAFVLSLRSAFCMDRQQWQEAIDYHQQAADLDVNYAKNPQTVYTRLIRGGQDDLALPFLLKDQAHPIRVHLWRGISLRNRGDLAAAEREWQAAAKAKDPQAETFEFLLANYYLGDKEGAALSIVLESMREAQQPSWTIFFLAALGWAVRNDMNSAITNFRLSRLQGRAMGYGDKLPDHLWYYCKTMLSPEQQEQIAGFFEQGADAAGEQETGEVELESTTG